MVDTERVLFRWRGAGEWRAGTTYDGTVARHEGSVYAELGHQILQHVFVTLVAALARLVRAARQIRLVSIRRIT